jgi:hypothetical protein
MVNFDCTTFALFINYTVTESNIYHRMLLCDLNLYGNQGSPNNAIWVIPYSRLFSLGFYFRLFSRSNVNRQNKFREILIQNLYFQFRFGNVSSIYVEQIYNGRWSLINIVETCPSALCVNFHNWFLVHFYFIELNI